MGSAGGVVEGGGDDDVGGVGPNDEFAVRGASLGALEVVGALDEEAGLASGDGHLDRLAIVGGGGGGGGVGDGAAVRRCSADLRERGRGRARTPARIVAEARRDDVHGARAGHVQRHDERKRAHPLHANVEVDVALASREPGEERARSKARATSRPTRGARRAAPASCRARPGLALTSVFESADEENRRAESLTHR